MSNLRAHNKVISSLLSYIWKDIELFNNELTKKTVDFDLVFGVEKWLTVDIEVDYNFNLTLLRPDLLSQCYSLKKLDSALYDETMISKLESTSLAYLNTLLGNDLLSLGIWRELTNNKCNYIEQPYLLIYISELFCAFGYISYARAILNFSSYKNETLNFVSNIKARCSRYEAAFRYNELEL